MRKESFGKLSKSNFSLCVDTTNETLKNMNTKFKVLVSLLAMSSVAYGVAPSIEIKKALNSPVFNLIYHGQTTGTVKVRVTDENGTILANRIVRNLKDFALPFNFENQAPGKYIINVDDKSGSQSKEVIFEPIKHFYARVKPLQDARYLVSVSNPTREAVRVNIFDEDGLLVMTQQTRENIAFLYNLANVKGQPSFEITSEQ